MDLNTRLDQSLDQIIKENRSQRQSKSQQQAKKKSKAKAAASKQVSNIAARLSATGAAKPMRRAKNTAKVAAPVQSARSGISARLGGAGNVTSKVLGNGKISGRVGKAAKAESGGRLAGLAEKKRMEEQKQKAMSKEVPKIAPNVKISIRGEAGPATVFISNLDSEASPEDVMTCFKQFGAIKNCTLLYDRMGKASGHAEVTYVAKQSAEEAVAKLNNALADGRRLSVQLVKGEAQQPAQGQQHGGSSSSHRDGYWRKKRRAGGNHMDID